MKKTNNQNKIITLLYLLMRDDITCGRMEEIIMQLEKSKNSKFTLSNGYLGAYAKEIFKRLIK